MSVVDRVVDERRTRAHAEKYLSFLYEPEAQAIAAKHFFRPTHAATLAETRAVFAELELFDVASLGGWAAVQEQHFIDGGTFDQVWQKT